MICRVSIKILKSTAQSENVLTVFDDVTADMLSNKKPNQIVTEIFIRGRKLSISNVFITNLISQDEKILN